MNHDTDADVTVLETIPNTHQRWDKDYPGPGLFSPAEDGPAVQELARKRNSDCTLSIRSSVDEKAR